MIKQVVYYLLHLIISYEFKIDCITIQESFFFFLFQVKSSVSDESKNSKECSSPSVKKRKDPNKEDIDFADWRYGAARIWYDCMDIPEDCKDFSFGFKLKNEVMIMKHFFLQNTYIVSV